MMSPGINSGNLFKESLPKKGLFQIPGEISAKIAPKGRYNPKKGAPNMAYRSIPFENWKGQQNQPQNKKSNWWFFPPRHPSQ